LDYLTKQKKDITMTERNIPDKAATADLLEKIEERMIGLLSQFETYQKTIDALRKDIQTVTQENGVLRTELETTIQCNQRNEAKMKEILQLVETVNYDTTPHSNVSNLAVVKSAL
jgi:regulator of replication initiation timing